MELTCVEYFTVRNRRNCTDCKNVLKLLANYLSFISQSSLLRAVASSASPSLIFNLTMSSQQILQRILTIFILTFLFAINQNHFANCEQDKSDIQVNPEKSEVPSELQLLQLANLNEEQNNNSSEVVLEGKIHASLNSSLSSKRRKRSNWESFLLAHTLNPADPRNSNFEYWTNRDWNYWARRREPLHDYANDYKGPLLTKKRLNAVIIASPAEVEDAFIGKLVYYGYDDLYWSNRKFHTFILRRYDSSATSALDVYDCGRLFFAAHLVRGRPVHFQTGFPSEYDYPFVSDLNFNLKRHCYRVPADNGRETYYPGWDRQMGESRPRIRVYTFN